MYFLEFLSISKHGIVNIKHSFISWIYFSLFCQHNSADLISGSNKARWFESGCYEDSKLINTGCDLVISGRLRFNDYEAH